MRRFTGHLPVPASGDKSPEFTPAARFPRGVRHLALAFVVLAACTTFEDPSIVHDLRILGLAASTPEQVLDVDIMNPPSPEQLAAMLEPTQVCALIADPAATRRLRWSMRLCLEANDLRCADVDAEHPRIALGDGELDDPERTPGAAPACATVNPTVALANLIVAALRADPFGGFSGVDVAVELTVTPETDDGTPVAAETIVGAKRLRYAARVPATRVANVNPTMARIDAEVNGAAAVPLPLGRCPDQAAPLRLHVGDEVKLTPIEPDGVRETYDVPTLDGGSRTFTESLTYQWPVIGGDISRFDTGGPRDGVGNVPELDSTWRTPDSLATVTVTDFPMWIIQRDERLGASWLEACLRVEP